MNSSKLLKLQIGSLISCGGKKLFLVIFASFWKTCMSNNFLYRSDDHWLLFYVTNSSPLLFRGNKYYINTHKETTMSGMFIYIIIWYCCLDNIFRTLLFQFRKIFVNVWVSLNICWWILTIQIKKYQLFVWTEWIKLLAINVHRNASMLTLH